MTRFVSRSFEPLTLAALAATVAALVTAAGGPAVVAQAVAAPAGLVGAYSFDEGSGTAVGDASGNGNSGVVENASWTAGKYGGALSFPGSHSWVTVGDAPSLDLTSGMTLEAWVKPALLGSSWRTVVLKQQTSALDYALYANDDAGGQSGHVYTTAEQVVRGGSGLPLGSWTHLAATYDGSGLRLYVNGTLAASRAVSGAIVSSSGPLRIGGNSLWGEYFNGVIDEVRVYNRALSANEIQTDMNTPIGGTTAPDTTAPTAPADLHVTGSSPTSISIAWSASTDDVAVAGYAVYVDGNKTAATTATSRTVDNLACGTSYVLAVEAYDAAGNVSSRPSITGATAACASPAAACGSSSTPPGTWKHVIWIWMENRSYDGIIGSSSAPYINQLAAQCGLATDYHGVTHPSLPNYIAATSGDYWGIADDNGPSSHPLSVPSIFSQVAAAGMEWRSYEESMPSNCAVSSSGDYAVKHNPPAYYVPISSDCARWDVPMGTTTGGNFLSDLQNGTIPAFSFVTPNMCDDMHDCSISTGDGWLKTWIPLILASPAYTNGSTAIFLTWDEDDGSAANHVPMIVVSPTTPSGTAASTPFDHYSLLKTTEQMLGLGTYLEHAADPTTDSLAPAFHLLP